MKIAVTGADGFIGARTCDHFLGLGCEVLRIVRRREGPGANRTVIPDYAVVNDWRPILEGADAVVHLAARAHVIKETSAEPELEFRRDNFEVTARLAEHAVASGVKRFIFVSSIGVNGAQTHGRPFTERDEPCPHDLYARSKLECERFLNDLKSRTGLQIVILRPPLVYGPGVKGNLLRMLKLVASGVPLPLRSVSNKRSLISIENLTLALERCVEADSASGQTFVLAEPQPRSTPEIFSALYAGMNRSNRLFGFPSSWLRLASTALGVRPTFDKLCSSLEVDASKAMSVLAWVPKETFHDGMAATARWYLERGSAS